METRATTVGDNGSGSVQGRGFLEYKNGELDPPENIIMSVAAARTYRNNFKASHTGRVVLYSSIEGLIEGNPPYPPEELAAAGLSHIANVNTLDADAKFRRVALTFFNLSHQAESYVVFEIEKLNDLGQDHDYSGWAQIMSKNWTRTIKKKWRGFNKQMNMLHAQLVKFGVSPAIFSDEGDFRWKTVDLNMFFCADKTSIDSDEWDCMCIDTYFTIQKLYSIYMEMKDQEDSPWNIKELEKFLLRKANLQNKGQHYEDMLELQKAMQSHSFNFAASFSDSVRLGSLLYREFSGKISHYLFEPNGDSQEFLMKISEQYEDFQECLIVFTYSAGASTIYGNRGVGHKIFPVCQIMMRVDNSMIDMSNMASTVIVKSNSTAGRSMDPIRFIPGVATDIGQAEFQQNNLGANIPGLVQVAQYMEAKVDKNTIIGGDDPGMPDQERGSKSAPEVQMQSVKEFGVGKQTVNHFYETFDVLVEQMTIKMLHCKIGHPAYKICKYWKDKCIKDGVPPEIFETRGAAKNEMPEHLSVRAARVAGDGSNLGLIMGLNGVAGIAGGFGQKGQHNYRKDLITSRLGDDYAERYLADSAEPDESGSGASVAMLENLVMQNGQFPQATRDNNHKTHIGSHMSVGVQMMERLTAQQMDPMEADKVFEVLIKHLQDHINFLSQDSLNAAFMEQIEPSFRQLVKSAQLNRVRAQKMQQAEIRRRDEEEKKLEADMLEQQRKDMVAEREQSRKDFESQTKQERAKEQSDTKAEIMRRGVELKADNERRAIELKGEAERAKTRTPKEILADRTTEELESSLRGQVGSTPNPADFE